MRKIVHIVAPCPECGGTTFEYEKQFKGYGPHQRGVRIITRVLCVGCGWLASESVLDARY